jgi:uncharacterized integral membrane protein
MDSSQHDLPEALPTEASTASVVFPDPAKVPEGYELPAPNTARARESGHATAGGGATANEVETRSRRFRRNARQGRLHVYAVAVIVLVVALIALAATNTARVHVDWLFGSSRISLVWLVLAAAIIGWVLGVLASARFQWLTRAPRPSRQRRAQPHAPVDESDRSLRS